MAGARYAADCTQGHFQSIAYELGYNYDIGT